MQAATRARAWLSDGDNLLFTVLLALQLVPVWSCRYFPSQDGPAHLENARILLDYHDPARELLRAFYTINRQPEPNWFSHLALAGLMTMATPLIAEKLLLSGYVLLFPISVRFALRAVRPDAGWLAVLAFPFTYSLFLHMGFWNFVYSLPLFFFVVGSWVKQSERFSVRGIVVLAVLVLLVYFCHPVSLVMAAGAIGILAGWQILKHWRAHGRADFLSVLRALVLPPFIAFLLPVLLMASFLGRQGAAPLARVPPLDLGWQWVRLESLVSYDAREVIASWVLVWLFAALLATCLIRQFRKGQGSRGNAWLLVAAAFLLIYFVAPPGMAGGSYLNQRLALYPFFALLLWFATQEMDLPVQRAVRRVGVLLTVGFLALHTWSYHKLNGYLEEYVSPGAHIEPDSTLLPVCFSDQGHTPDGRLLSLRVAPFLHAAGHIAVQRQVVDLDNYEAQTGYFPILYRPTVNPYRHLLRDFPITNRGLAGLPPAVDIAAYENQTGQRIDYVLVWGLRPDQLDKETTRALLQQLERAYNLVYTSPQGYAKLYRRKAAGRALWYRHQSA